MGLFSFFLSSPDAFISVCCLVALAGTCSIRVNRGDQSRDLCLRVRVFGLSLVNTLLAVGFS